MSDETYTRDHLVQAYLYGQAETIARVQAERASSYTEGTVPGTDPTTRCMAEAEGLTMNGEPVLCMRQQGHDLGPYDRHKAVYGEPHLAVSWNDPGADYHSPMADPDSYAEGG